MNSRWLTLLPAAERMLYLFKVIKHYFIWFLPNKKKQKPTLHWNNICNYLKQTGAEDIELQIIFVIESSTTFTSFLTFFQKSEPMIHALFDHIRNLIKILASKICIKSDLAITDLVKADNLLPITKIELSDVIVTKLNNEKVEKNKIIFRQNYRDHYKKTVEYLILKTTGNLEQIESFRFLNPKYINNKSTIGYLRSLLNFYPANNVSFNVKVLDEFKLFQFENKLKYDSKSRIDEYWTTVFEQRNSCNEPKYPNLAIVVKNIICISHGNSDVERGFSISGHVLTDDRTLMTEKTLNARLNTLDGLRPYNNQIYKVPIPMDLILKAQQA